MSGTCLQFPENLNAGTVIQGRCNDNIQDQNELIINGGGSGSVAGTYITANAETKRVIKGGSTMVVCGVGGEDLKIIAQLYQQNVLNKRQQR